MSCGGEGLFVTVEGELYYLLIIVAAFLSLAYNKRRRFVAMPEHVSECFRKG
jgi:hypothetical protein